VEFAIAMPIMLLLMAGIVDFGLLFQSYEVVTNAAREGARLAVLPGYDVNSYQTARNRVAAWGTFVTSIAPLAVGAGGLAGVQVTVDYTHQFMLVGPVVGLINGTFNNALTYRVDVCMRMELQP
jgi:Flp pilus assembly protein TadG